MSRQAASSQFHISKTLDNKYIIGDEIGKGAHARVYKGLDLENGDFVAIKQVSLENIAQEDLNIIMLEIDLLKNLNHKNIVKYLGSLKTKTHLHIILEYVENGSLANIIKPNKFGPFPESLAAFFITQVLEGLVYLHEQGVIHRDIKGANILTTKEGLVKLADFGVATKLTEADLNTHSVVGTPYWMAPEVIEMSGVCAASDIWSVGCTVIELLTCVPPYYDLQPMPALFRIVQDENPPIPDRLTPDITDFLRQCFKKDARQRPGAKTLLSHPWIQNCRRLQSSLRHSGTLRNIEEDSSVHVNALNGHDPSDFKCPAAQKVEGVALELEIDYREELLSTDSMDGSSKDIGSRSILKGTEIPKDDVQLDQVPTFSVHDKSSVQADSLSGEEGKYDPSSNDLVDKNHEGNRSLANVDGKEVAVGPKKQDNSFLTAVEFGRLVGSLRPEESEDVIVSACQKLIAFFNQRPEQKIIYVSQHGLLPLMELLEVSRSRVICSVLQLINQIIKDYPDSQENACLIGMIPVVMSFAVTDHPREVRIEAAYFLQQLCQSSSLTLQMFIACRGIPVLVGFLEADYAKYREMVHIAIDGMWQIFKLRGSTPRNDFCRIAAKNGILLRLINTLYSLNEATRLALISGIGGVILEGSAAQPRSGPLDFSHPIFVQGDRPIFGPKQPENPNVSHGIADYPLPLTQEPPHLMPSHSQRSDTNDRQRMSHSGMEPYVPFRVLESTSVDKVTEAFVTTSKEREHLEQWKYYPSRAEADLKPTRSIEGVSNGLTTSTYTQQDQIRPLLSLLDKEPPSIQFSGQLDYVRHLSGLERHESILPLLHASNERKNNSELDFLMAEFAEVSELGKNGNAESTARFSFKTSSTKAGPLPSSEGATSTSGIASQTASGVLSGSGVLNARPGSATSSGLLSHMASSLNADVAREYLEKVADLLLEFARADTTVKSYMCNQSLLSRLFQMLNRVEPPILLKILKCVNHLSADPNCLENLQRSDAIKYLIPNLELKDGPLISQIHHEVLNALFNLCKINKRRQEQAAENGIIPHLMHFIMSDSPLKQYALPLLCDMAHASRNSREQLRAHGGLDVYLRLLDDEYWSVTSLDAIAVCLAHDNDDRKVEQALLKKDAVQKLVKFFQCCPGQHFVHILDPFLKIISKSSRINTTLAVNGLTPLLIARLRHQDAIARLNLLRLIKAVYEHHPRPKQLIVENDLPRKLQNLIEERRDGQHSGGQVLVKQMATSLLKALHINTVL